MRRRRSLAFALYAVVALDWREVFSGATTSAKLVQKSLRSLFTPIERAIADSTADPAWGKDVPFRPPPTRYR